MRRPPLLISFLGFPGSGKTYFSTHLAKKLPAVTLNSDAMRMAMFGSLDKIESLRQTDNARLYTDVFGAINYATRQILRSGQNVIYDAQSTKRKDRRSHEQLANGAGGIHVLVWIKTTPEVAIKRGQERISGEDSHQYTDEKMHYFIDRFSKVTELPEPDENVIEISGEAPFEEQYATFIKAIEELYG